MKEKLSKKSESGQLKHDLEKEVKEYLDALKRLKAEFENYQKRIEKEKEDFRKYAAKDLILKLLEIKDNFERALGDAKEDDFTKGMRLILKKFEDVLEKEGVKMVKAVGEKFDPYKHEAIAHEVSEVEDLILEEMEKGYQLFEKVIRPSKVKVSKLEESKNE